MMLCITWTRMQDQDEACRQLLASRVRPVFEIGACNEHCSHSLRLQARTQDTNSASVG